MGLLSRLLGRPVAYVEDRRDSFLGHCREQRHRFEIAADAAGRIIAFRDEFVADVGTVSPGNGWTMPLVTATVFPTVYDVPNVEVSCTLAATNKAPWQPVRGYGKEVANLVMERAVDLLADHLRMDKAELGANLLRPEPCRAGCPPASTSTAAITRRRWRGSRRLRLRRLARTPAAAAAARSNGHRHRHRLRADAEAARAPALPQRLRDGEHPHVAYRRRAGPIGVTSPGSGNETGIAQLVGGVLGLPPEAIRVVQGDTDAVPVGTGNASSRAILYGGAAAHLAAVDLRAKLAACAANLLQARPEEITFVDGEARAPEGGSVHIAALALGAHTHPSRSATAWTCRWRPRAATRAQRARDAGRERRIATYSSFPYSMHAVAVELDPGTGRVTCWTWRPSTTAA